MAKYKSRAVRCSEACDALAAAAVILRDAVAMDENVNSVTENIGQATSEFETLADELESWKDNMSGTNLENTQKYQDLETVVDTLRDCISTAEEISDALAEATQDELAEHADALDDVASDSSNIEFPTAR
jgi:chromosome segregation ATPase